MRSINARRLGHLLRKSRHSRATGYQAASWSAFFLPFGKQANSVKSTLDIASSHRPKYHLVASPLRMHYH